MSTCQSTNRAVTGGEIKLKSRKKPHVKALQPLKQRWLNCGSSLQVLFDLGRVLSVETLGFLVELGVPLVDVVDISVVIVGSAPAKLGAFLDPVGRKAE